MCEPDSDNNTTTSPSDRLKNRKSATSPRLDQAMVYTSFGGKRRIVIPEKPSSGNTQKNEKSA